MWGASATDIRSQCCREVAIPMPRIPFVGWLLLLLLLFSHISCFLVSSIGGHKN